MVGQHVFFDLSDRYAALIAAGDPLERWATVVDFEVFRGPLITALRRSERGKEGRQPFDPLMIFKILAFCRRSTHSLTKRPSSSSRTGSRSSGSWGWRSMARCPMPPRYSCSGRGWCSPKRSTGSSRASMQR